MERPELSIAVQRAPDEIVFHLAGEIDVLTVTDAGILRISSFGDAGLVTAFGFQPAL